MIKREFLNALSPLTQVIFPKAARKLMVWVRIDQVAPEP